MSASNSNTVVERFVSRDEISMARPTILAERGDLPSSTTVLVMGVPAHIDKGLAVTGPLLAVAQICCKSIVVDYIPPGHSDSFLKNIKGMFGRRTDHSDPYASREYQSMKKDASQTKSTLV